MGAPDPPVDPPPPPVPGSCLLKSGSPGSLHAANAAAPITQAGTPIKSFNVRFMDGTLLCSVNHAVVKIARAARGPRHSLPARCRFPSAVAGCSPAVVFGRRASVVFGAAVAIASALVGLFHAVADPLLNDGEIAHRGTRLIVGRRMLGTH